MNKAAIKTFAIWARNKLITDITYKAGLMGITESGIKKALPQSGNGTEYYDIGMKEPYAISGKEVRQRKDFVDALHRVEAGSDYQTAYRTLIDETAYTWFNRLIAVRFMEVNDYLPSRIRVLSSVSGKLEPDIVTTPFEAMMEYSDEEKQKIVSLKSEERSDEAFRILYLKQCNELNKVLPVLFEKISDYTELLLALSFTDKEGLVYRLVHDIPEDDFNVEIGGQVEIIGWMYQYYNTEPKAKVFARASGTKIKKEEIPAATQLFTPDWIVRYMVENSLGRLWVEGHPNEELTSGWKYYLEEAEQEHEVQGKLSEIREGYSALQPEDLLCIDPCMGSGHILCYFFDVLMQIYESQGYSQRDAAQSILENNIYGLDIDERAYQLSYFAVMMKARQYDRRILSRGIQPHVYAIVESNGINRSHLSKFGTTLDELQRNNAMNQINGLIDALYDAKEYGSILSVDNLDWELLREFSREYSLSVQMSIDEIGIEETQKQLQALINVGEALSQRYHIVATNPPYMAISSTSAKLNRYINRNFVGGKTDLFSVFIERCLEFTRRDYFTSMITMQSWMFLTSFEKIRDMILRFEMSSMVHLGARAFDEISGEVVQTTAFTVRKADLNGHYSAIYSRVVSGNSESEKATMFLERNSRFNKKAISFAKVPQKIIAYWVSEATLDCFEEKSLDEIFVTREGMATADNDRFLRLWYEPSFYRITFDCNSSENALRNNIKWVPYNKGGGTRDWYGNNDYVVNWENDGLEIRNNKDEKTGRIRSHNYNGEFGFKEGLTWSAISSSDLSVRYCPQGFLFDSKGAKGFAKTEKNLFWILGLLNSKVAMQFLQFISPTLDFKVGDIISLPYKFDEKYHNSIDQLVKEQVRISKDDWDSFETSWDFSGHPLIKYRHSVSKTVIDPDWSNQSWYIKNAYEAWEYQCQLRFDSLSANEEKLNSIFINMYGLQKELTPTVDKENILVRKANLQRDIKSLISYAVGCMLGRYSHYVDGLLYAGGHWDYGTIVERISDAAKQAEDGKWLPSEVFVPDRDAIIPITDEEYFEDDIVGLFCAWLKKVYGAETLEENLDFIAQALGNKGNSSREVLRNYFLKDFFKDHCDTYSVTGSGKRPIYWLYSSGNQNGFKALVYMHRYDADTTGRVRADYLQRMVRVYENEIARMEEVIEASDNNREVANATKRKEKLQKQLKECRDYDEKIAPLALSRINIDLDDGVKVNYRKVQTDNRGKFHEILADSSAIMSKEK